MVPGRRAHDTAGTLFIGQPGELVQWAADLVGTGSLEHLGLQPYVEAASLAEDAGGQQRRAVRVRGNQFERRLEDVPPQGKFHCFTAVNMISTRPSAATRPDCTVARAGKSFWKNSRYGPFIAAKFCRSVR